MNIYSNYYLKIFVFLIFLFNLFGLIALNNLDSLDYTHSLSLINGNIFIIHRNGVMVFNYNFTIILYDYNFNGEILILSDKENNLTSLIQCSDNVNQYVIAIIYNKIYIFSSRGEYLFHLTNNFFSDYSFDNLIYFSYTFLFYRYDSSNYYFILGFVNNEKNLRIIQFIINMDNHNLVIKDNIIHNVYNLITDVFSCQIINSNNLGCFYIKLIENNQKYLFVPIFDLDNNLDLKSDSQGLLLYSNDNHFLIKSLIGNEKNIAYGGFISETAKLHWFVFDFDTFKGSEPKCSFDCTIGTNLININYFKYNDEYIYSCLYDLSNRIIIFKFIGGYNNTDEINNNINTNSKINYVDFIDCTSFINYDLIYLLYEGKYDIISNFYCGLINTQILNFPSYLNIDNYIRPTAQPDMSYIIPSITPKIYSSIPINIYTTIPNIQTTIPLEIRTSTIPSSHYNNILTSLPSTLNTIIKTDIKSTFISPTFPEINKCNLKCLICDEDSIYLNLCIKCNKTAKYFPSIVIGYYNYFECYNEDTKPLNYFFNNLTKYYEPCYPNCKTCNYQGNDDINNCTSCKNNYIFRPDEINSTNCVNKCQYYYYIYFNNYYCTINNQCPKEANLLIKNKGKCIDNCINDNEYQYQLNYECVKKCPENTFPDENNICKLKEKKCYLYSDDSFLNINYNDLETNYINNLIERYIKGFENTDLHVDFYLSQNYTITIYKTMECLKELEMVSTIINFKECYEKIQEKYNISENIIILISDLFNNKKLYKTLYYLFDPDTGKELSIDDICEDKSFVIEKSLTNYPEIDVGQAKFFGNQEINIFNSSDIFYNDLCYQFESPNGKDVPLKKRILIFYPNITLCEDNCDNIGVNLTSMKAICKCKLKDLLNEAKDASKLVGFDYANIIESLSIDVLKCYKTVFQYKYFINCFGGMTCIVLIMCQSICALIACKISMYKIRKITFFLVEKYC